MKVLHRPATIIIAFTAICLIAFLVTIPLPRIDGQLVSSDGINYFAYLPTLVYDHDLDFRNQWETLLASSPDLLNALMAHASPDSPMRNPHGIGLALVLMPFYLLATALAKLMAAIGVGGLQEGHSTFHQAVTLSGSIVLGGVGLWFTYRFARQLASEKSALIATVVIAAAGNIIYYMTAEPSMSHNVSLFLSAAFFLYWVNHQTDERAIVALVYGLLGGAMAIVRPHDGLFLALPFLAQIPAIVASSKRRQWRPFWIWTRNCLVAAFAALLVFGIQLLVWNQMYGSPFKSPYGNAGEFTWLQPYLVQVLFSSRRGMFIWHPIFLASVIGLLFTYRQNKTFAVMGLIGLVIQIYVICAWSWWWQGSAFGTRMMIVCTPIFVMGLASLQDAIAKQWSWKPIYVTASALIAWNFLLYVYFRFYLVYAEMTQPATWYDMTLGRIMFIINRL